MNSIICTVDVVLLTLVNDEAGQKSLAVALLRRAHAPFENQLALPGAYIHPEEDMDARDAAERMLRTKMGLVKPYLEQLETFSGPMRDPRGWSVSVAYFAVVSADLVKDIEGVELKRIDELRALPFDHLAIVTKAVARLRNTSAYSTLPAHLLPEQFTMPQLQAVYQAVLGKPLTDKVTFSRRMEELDALEAVPGLVQRDVGRPAQIYRLKPQYRHKLSVLDRGLGKGK